MSLGLADIPRNLKISKHTGEAYHLQYFDNASSGRAMSPTRLVDLARLNVESSITRQVDFDSVIINFANKNTRKSFI